MADRGKKITLGVVIYMMVKAILNLVIGFSGENVATLIIYAALACLLLLPSSRVPKASGFFKYANYITAVYLGLVMLSHIAYNLQNLPGTWLYLTEAILDIAAIFLICFQKDARNYFNEK